MPDHFYGSCLCSAIRYELHARPKAVSHCHCSQCRKGHGAAFASYGSVLRTDLLITHGAEQLASYASSEAVLRQFCSQCGSSLFWSKTSGEFGGWISIALGTLDSPFTAEKQQHVEVSSKAAWYAIEDHWPQSR